MKRLLITFLCLSTSALAGPMYKCKGTNSIVTYQKKPCSGSTEIKVIEEKPPKPEEVGSGGSLREGILIGDFEVKDEGVNSIGSHWFSCKVKVWNRTNKEEKVLLSYKGLDSDGFEVDRVIMSGTILPNSYEALSNRHVMDDEAFNRVAKWVLQK
jgi:hypothetical protein